MEYTVYTIVELKNMVHIVKHKRGRYIIGTKKYDTYNETAP